MLIVLPETPEPRLIGETVKPVPEESFPNWIKIPDGPDVFGKIVGAVTTGGWGVIIDC